MKKYSLIILTTLLFLNLSAYAADNIINSVIISNAKDGSNTYELNIDSTQATSYKMHKESDKSVYFDLKNSKLAKNAGTIYDDVTNIDSVAVRQEDNNRVRIYVQGQDVENTELVFVNSLFEGISSEPASKKISLSRPISEYQSTDYRDDLEEDDIQEWSDNSFNLSHLGLSVLNGLKKGPMGVILTVLAMFAAILILIRTITSKIAHDREPLIGLNSATYADDIELERSKASSEALRAATAEVARAHNKYQTYLKSKYSQNHAPKKPSANPDILKSIALNQYQKSTTNPYSNQEVLKMNTQKPRIEEDFKIPPRPKMTRELAQVSPIRQTKSEFSSPYIKRNLKATPAQKFSASQAAPAAANKSSNMKFLESVTKIYEQSGREDLALGLKKSISKTTKI